MGEYASYVPELEAEIERARLLERFAAHPFANLETYKYFNQRGEQASAAKADFIDAAMAGDTPDAPEFSYPLLDIDELAARRDELTELLDGTLKLDMTQEANVLLREKITDRIHEVGCMLLAKAQSTLSPGQPMYEAVSYQLGENMREVYGAPEPEHWQGILGYRLSKLAATAQADDAPDDVRTAWEFVRDALPQDLPIERPYSPRPETLRWYAEQLEARTAQSRATIEAAIEHGYIQPDQAGKLTGENIVRATRLALDARGYSQWAVELTDESNIDTSQEKQTIFIPAKRVMSLDQFEKVILAHEIDQHVSRRENGDRSGEPILGGTGCAGYLAWEEGNGKANEALLSGKVANEASAFNFYLSGGLALGLDGRGARNFGQMFDLVWRARFIEAYARGKHDNTEQAKRVLLEKTYDSLVRIFRGTDGRAPGVIFTKDAMTYYLGQAQVWQKWDADMALSESDRQQEHKLERSAKIDPLRSDHRRVAQKALTS